MESEECNGSQNPLISSIAEEKTHTPFFVLRDLKLLGELKQAIQRTWSSFKATSNG